MKLKVRMLSSMHLIWDIIFDTANGYSAGTSEEYLGKALKKNVARNQVVIASRYILMKVVYQDRQS